MANAIYDKGREAFLTGAINWSSDTIKVALVTSSYTPNLASHQYYSSVNSNVVGTPQTLANKTVTNGVADGDDVTFTAVSASTINYVLIYKDTGSAATSPLICLFDTASGLPLTVAGDNVETRFDSGSNKIFKL